MTQHEPLFLAWYDDDKKKTDLHKAQDGVQAYLNRFGVRPLVLVCHTVIALPELTVQVRHHVPVNNFWLGMEGLR
jgi:hypothetical protein